MHPQASPNTVVNMAARGRVRPRRGFCASMSLSMRRLRAIPAVRHDRGDVIQVHSQPGRMAVGGQ